MVYTNAVYWPNYRVYHGDSPGQLNYGCINRVYYAFATVTADGSVFVSRFNPGGSGLSTDSLTSLATSTRIPASPVTAFMALWGL